MDISKKKDGIDDVALGFKVCKPLSVTVTRLSPSAISKFTSRASADVKKKKIEKPAPKRYYWRNGLVDCERRRRRKRRERLARRRKLLQLANAKTTIEDETMKKDETVTAQKDGKIVNSYELEKESPNKLYDSHQNQKSNINQALPESEKNDLSSSERVTFLDVKLQNELTDATMGNVDENVKEDSVQCFEKISDISSHKHTLRHATSKDDDNERISRSTAKRKRLSISHNHEDPQESTTLLRESKRSESAKSVEDCNDKTSLEEANIASISKAVENPKKHYPKSVRRRINLAKEAFVVVERLEHLQDPLIQQWKEKMTLNHENRTEETTNNFSAIDEDLSKSRSDENLDHEKPKDSDNNTAITATLKTSSNEESEQSIQHKIPGKPEKSSKDADRRSEYYDNDDDHDEEIMAFMEFTSLCSSSYSRRSRKTPSLRRSARLHSRIGFDIDSISDSEESAEKVSVNHQNKTDESMGKTSPMNEELSLKSAATEAHSRQGSPAKIASALLVTNDEKPESIATDTAISSTTALPNSNICTSFNKEHKIHDKPKKSSKSANRKIDYYDANDEEVMEFMENTSSCSSSYTQRSRKTPSLRRSARLHSRMGFNIDGSSDSEKTETPAWLLRSHAKSPSTIRSSPERKRPETRMSRMLRLMNTPAKQNSDSEDSNRQNGIPTSPSSQGLENSNGKLANSVVTKSPPSHRSAIRTSIDSTTSESSIRPPISHKKSARCLIDDSSSESNENLGEPLTDIYDEDLSSPMPSQDDNRIETTENLNNQNTIEHSTVNILNDKTEHFLNDQLIHRGDRRVGAMIEDNPAFSENGDLSDSTNPPSSHRSDIRDERKKLPALNVMAHVVLTRLEDLHDIFSSDGYSEGTMELRNGEDTPWSSNEYRIAESSWNDSLEINKEGNQTSGRDSPIVASISGPTRTSPRKLAPLNRGVYDESENRLSQDTTESEVELCLSLEDDDINNDKQISQSQSSGIGSLCDNSACNVVAGVPCTCEKGKQLTNRLMCQTTTTAHKCVICDRHFDDPVSLEKHKASNFNCNEFRCDSCRITFKTSWMLSQHTACCSASLKSCIACDSVFNDLASLKKHKASSVDCAELRCNFCQFTFKTPWGLSKHRTCCPARRKSKEKSADETRKNEAETDSRHNSTVESTSSSKTKSMKPTKKLPKKQRNQGRSDDPICNVCSKNFVTKQALSEHIYKHSPEELQEAFRIQKAKMLPESEEARAATEKNKGKSADNENAHCSNTANAVAARRSSRINNDEYKEPVVWTNARNSNSATTSNDPTIANICPCHREDHANVDKNDLQIEMVLVCHYCKVLFRRGECFEVHYRTSPGCAVNDRTQGRLPKLFCANCQLTLHSWNDMRHHLEVHASVNADGTVRFVCNICRVVFIGFGALFYAHWGNHSKSSMFVASRYSFPKNSVQPIDGLARLPTGASTEEIYIWVAEHVCAECKKPFSTRPDLISHQETDSCCAKSSTVETTDETVDANDSQWYCDVCDMTFADRDELNDHGASRHGRHYTCVSTSPKNKTFMCTKCCAMRKRIKDIEEHWKTHPQHNSCRFDMETNTVTNETEDASVAIITPLWKENQSNENLILQNGVQIGETLSAGISAMSTNDKAEKSAESKKKRSEKRHSRAKSPDVFHAVEENTESRINNFSENREFSIATATVIEAAKKTNGSSARDSLRETSIIHDSTEKPTAKQKTRVGALEDPCVNFIVSGSSSPELSASLVIDESRDRNDDESVDGIDTHSYQILKMDNNPKSSSGPIKMVFSRKSLNDSEKMSRRNELSSKINGGKESEKKSTCKTKADSGTCEKALDESQLKKTLSNNSTGTMVEKTKMKTVANISKTSVDKGPNSLIPPLVSNQHAEPEIIDIIEEIEMPCENDQIQTNGNPSATSKIASTKSSTKTKIPRTKKIAILKLNKSGKKKPSPGNSGSEMNTSINDSGKSNNSDAARREPLLSFEESRYAARLLAEKNARIAAASNKQGFLRVKNISELQAVKKYSCLLCNASFETTNLLDEHRQQHFNSNLKPIPKGISAALKLPDSSESPETTIAPTTKSVQFPPTQSYIPQRAAKNNPGPTVNGANVIVTGGSGATTGNQKTPLSNSLLNGSNVMNTFNPNVAVTKSVITSTASVAQHQQSSANQTQPLNSPISYTANNYRQLPESRNSGQIGYHVLPQIVIQSNRQLTNVIPQHNSSINDLPTTGISGVTPIIQNQLENLNKFVCEVCSNFECDNIGALNEHVTTHAIDFNDLNVAHKTAQPSISTVIVPQTSSFTTFNDVLPNNATMGNKSTSDRLVVNNWILRNSSIVGWPTTTFDQQTAPTMLPINTQSLLTSTVTNPNGNSTNLDKTSAVWSTSTWNPPISTSVETIDKQSHSTMSIPMLNINNNGTNASKQQGGWSTPTFEDTAEILGGQIVYQCMLCQSAMYSNYEHFRRHLMTVHDDANLARYRVENFVRRHYYCTRCPNGAPPFDTALKLATHQNTGHSNVCPVCQRIFQSYVFLNDHVLHCRANNGRDIDRNY